MDYVIVAEDGRGDLRPRTTTIVSDNPLMPETVREKKATIFRAMPNRSSSFSKRFAVQEVPFSEDFPEISLSKEEVDVNSLQVATGNRAKRGTESHINRLLPGGGEGTGG